MPLSAPVRAWTCDECIVAFVAQHSATCSMRIRNCGAAANEFVLIFE